MNECEAAEGLRKVFVNREDVYSRQTDDGRYICVHQPLTREHLLGHLRGVLTLGAFLLDKQCKASFGVLDADDEETFWKQTQACNRLWKQGIPSYLERSRRGGHLWFFFADKVDGQIAKNFCMEVAKRNGINAEVFPKQGKSPIGSAIRMPFGIHRKSGERYPFLNLGGWLEQMNTITHPSRVPLETILNWQYREEPHPIRLKPADGSLPLWEQVKQRITVVDLVEQFVELKPNGSGMIGKCPFHEDTIPSFSINVSQNYWNCFAGCGGGSVIDFWMKLKNVEFNEAVRQLDELTGGENGRHSNGTRSSLLSQDQ